ncbi:MAG: CoA ester lyase [Alphaproteobacteria bacterium]|nr:MAG: CoA ester lyase [Alphaproteobacteria bacterium]
MRSWLFAPGDSEKKMAKAADSPADIVLLDLEDSVMPEGKPAARAQVSAFLTSRSDRQRIWVRINPMQSGEIEKDLAAIMATAPGGVMLPKAEGREDVEALDAILSEHEAQHGIAQGSTLVAALVTETAAAMFTTGSYCGAPRLAAMTWGAEDLGAAIGARIQHRPDGQYMPVFELARTLCLLGAAAAGVAPIETIMPDFRDLEGLAARARMVRSQGFRGMLAIHPDQIATINAAFTPGEEEIAHARRVIAAFSVNPGQGAARLDGSMVDIPHLKLAKALLADAGLDE